MLFKLSNLNLSVCLLARAAAAAAATVAVREDGEKTRVMLLFFCLNSQRTKQRGDGKVNFFFFFIFFIFFNCKVFFVVQSVFHAHYCALHHGDGQAWKCGKERASAPPPASTDNLLRCNADALAPASSSSSSVVSAKWLIICPRRQHYQQQLYDYSPVKNALTHSLTHSLTALRNAESDCCCLVIAHHHYC